MGKPLFKHVSPAVEHSADSSHPHIANPHTSNGSDHRCTVRHGIHETVRNKNKITFRENRAIKKKEDVLTKTMLYTHL